VGDQKKPPIEPPKNSKLIGPSHRHGEKPQTRETTVIPKTFVDKKTQSGGSR
jgi:hypothetical protein